MTCLQYDLGIFKIEGPRRLHPGENLGLGDNFIALGSIIIARWGDKTYEGHDGGGVLEQIEQYYIGQINREMCHRPYLYNYLGTLRSRYERSTAPRG